MSNSIKFPYFVCKIISTRLDEQNGIKIYTGQAPIVSFLGIPDEENVRRYTVQANKKSKKLSDVHRGIKDTLCNNPEIFPLLNNGITLVSGKVDFSNDKKESVLKLTNPNIINGSQTRGVIKEFIENNNIDNEKKNISVKFEIIETQDKELMSEISISRNTQIRVERISIVGKKGVFDSIEDSFKKKNTNAKLKKSETDRGDQFLPTERILQVIATLIPKQLWEETGNKDYSKAPYYSRQSRAIRLYEAIYEEREGKKRALYQFYLDIAPDALELYDKWTCHPGFKGTGLKNGIERNEKNNITRVYDGLIFPIIATYALFLQKRGEKWKLEVGDRQEKIEKFLIDQAKRIFQETADSKAEKMGKDQRCYNQLYNLLEAIIYNPLTN